MNAKHSYEIQKQTNLCLLVHKMMKDVKLAYKP